MEYHFTINGSPLKKSLFKGKMAKLLLFPLHLAKSIFLLICSEYYSLQQSIILFSRIVAKCHRSIFEEHMRQAEYKDRLGYQKSIFTNDKYIFTNDISLILDRQSPVWLRLVPCSSMNSSTSHLYIVVRYSCT